MNNNLNIPVINAVISSYIRVQEFNKNYPTEFISTIIEDESFVNKKQYMFLQKKFSVGIKSFLSNLFFNRIDFKISDRVRLNSLIGNIESKWVRESIPKATDFFNNLEWEIYCRRILGVDIHHIPTHINCICGKPNDSAGHHLASNCSHGNERIQTHDNVTNIIYNMIKSANISCYREFHHSIQNNNRADISIYNIPGGTYKPVVMIDFAQVNPFAQTYISTNLVVGEAVLCKEKQKISKYTKANLITDDRELIPIIMDSMGLVNKKGKLFIKYIANVIANINEVQSSIIYKYWMKRIQVSFQKSLADAIISRSNTIRHRYNGLDYTCQVPYILNNSYCIYSSSYNLRDRLD
jgi:hypothetical protein